MKNPKKTIAVISIIIVLIVIIATTVLLYKNNNDKIFIETNDLDSQVAALLVDDVNETIKFYEKYFGFSLYKKYPFEGNITLAVMEYRKLYVMFQDRQLYEEKKQIYLHGEISPSFVLYIDVDSAKALYDKLKDELEVVQDYQLMFYGRNEFSVKDLNGYIITFSEDAKQNKPIDYYSE